MSYTHFLFLLLYVKSLLEILCKVYQITFLSKILTKNILFIFYMLYVQIKCNRT